MAKAARAGQLGERSVNPIMYLDIQIGDKAAGRICIELRADLCPKTCENFKSLCLGDTGTNKDGLTLMHYKGTPFHRIIKDQICQCGDIKHHDGTWSQSVFMTKTGSKGEMIPNPDQKFEDENFILRHTGPGGEAN